MNKELLDRDGNGKNHRKYSHILTKEFLEKRYLKEKVLVLDIAKEIGLSPSNIYSYMKYYKIPRFNWFNEEHRKKMSKMAKERIKREGHWAKGLTKETDERIKNLSKSKKQQWKNKNSNYRKASKKISKSVKRLWNNPQYIQKRGKYVRKLWEQKNKDKNLIYIDDDKENVIKLYKKGYDGFYLGEKYGVDSNTVLKRLKKWGVKIREPRFASKVFKGIKTDDGHLADSSQELFLDNWLFHNEITHIPHKKIGFGNHRCDFYIPDANLYIEYFGLLDREEYRKKAERKLKAYKKLNLNVLCLYPEDNLKQKLRPLLKYSKVQKQVTEFYTDGGKIEFVKE